MTKIIRLQSNQAVKSKISTTDIEAIDMGESVVLLSAVKKSINITYNSFGYADVSMIELGMQYDHRVTWLHFNLDQLKWHLNEQKGYTEETKYNFYTFKIAFTRIGSKPETFIWEFDGVDFEIPRGITKEAGLYQVVLIIEEWQGDDNLIGNIKNEGKEFIERFVTSPIQGTVSTSLYDPKYEIVGEVIETDQEAALIKPTILCSLSDDGQLIVDEKELGQKYDNFIRYFKFNPHRITAHLNDFNIFAIFKQGEKFYSSLFEITSPDDPYDDYTSSHPIIGWIPTNVYQSDGMWDVAIIAFAGKVEDIASNSDNGDYYFYVSKNVKMRVNSNNLTSDDVNKEAELAITTNLLSNAGEIIITEDDEIYEAAQKRTE